MKEKLLARLFSFARQHLEADEAVMPFGFEASVLVHWRAARVTVSEGLGMMRRLRWAAVAACVLALGSALWKQEELSRFPQRFNPENRIADSATSAWYADE